MARNHLRDVLSKISALFHSFNASVYFIFNSKWPKSPFGLALLSLFSLDLFISTEDDCECIIRHFFPNLQLLILLVDDEHDIPDFWRIKNGDFKEYEDDWGDFQPRWTFTEACTGLYKMNIQNEAYFDYIDEDIERRFKREEEDYEGYVAPLVMPMGCSLPPGLKITNCGRLPHGYGTDSEFDDSSDEGSDYARYASEVSSVDRSSSNKDEESEAGEHSGA
jgi:hypothetical protein